VHHTDAAARHQGWTNEKEKYPVVYPGDKYLHLYTIRELSIFLPDSSMDKPPYQAPIFCLPWFGPTLMARGSVGAYASPPRALYFSAKEPSKLVALLRKETCNLRHPMHLRHPV